MYLSKYIHEQMEQLVVSVAKSKFNSNYVSLKSNHYAPGWIYVTLSDDSKAALEAGIVQCYYYGTADFDVSSGWTDVTLYNGDGVEFHTKAIKFDYSEPGAKKPPKPNMSHYVRAIPNISTIQATNPETKEREPLMRIIMCLNDTHEWTREQIADWLDTLDVQPIFGVDK